MTVAALEYRPALFQAFGIGRYVKNLAPALLDADPALELVLFSVFLRGHARRAGTHDWPRARVRRVGVSFPGRLVPLLGRLGYAFDRRLGRFDLFHHTDYAVTPLRTLRRVVTLYDTAWLPHRGFVEPAQSRKMESSVRALLRGDPEIIVLSAFARDEIAGFFRIEPARIHVTPLAADPVFSEPLSGQEIAGALGRFGVRGPYAIALGTLEPRKNLVQLVRAVRLVRERIPELSLVLLGRKGYRHQEVFAEGAGLGGAFRWLGSVSDADAAALVRGAAALAFPSLYEGFGLPAIEGMAAGVPVIASDIPVMREICGNAALLVDTTGPGPLAEAICWAAGDSAASALARAGEARARAFTWRRCAEGTLAAYRSLLERTR